MKAIVFQTFLLMKKRSIKVLGIIVILITTVIVIKRQFDVHLVNYKQWHYLEMDYQSAFNTNNDIIAKYYEQRKNWKTSNLGSILFKNIGTEVYKTHSNKTFVIVVWKHWTWLKARHIDNYGSKNDPFGECSVKNCRFLPEKHIEEADAVLIHVQKGSIPVVKNRNLKQRWVFLSDESPMNTFSLSSKKLTLAMCANIFNWTMTYRSDSDVPVPYGRTLPLPSPVMEDMSNVNLSLAKLVPHWEDKQYGVLVTILMSNCAVEHRMDYVKELKRHVNVKVHGKCSTENKNSCPGGYRSDCKEMSKYLFYLVFENSMCRQYLTEKGFYNAYSKGAIPVIMGPPLKDCVSLLPPNSFLHVDNYHTPADLAQHIRKISENKESVLSFHRWRNHFEVANEHGYFGSRSYHYCRLCEALNYNDKKLKVYNLDNLRQFFDPSLTCVNK